MKEKLIAAIILLFSVSCSEEFQIVKHQNNNSDYYSLTTSYIESKVSSMADIYYYKIYLACGYYYNKGEESYSITVKHLGITFLNLENVWLEINGNKVELKPSRLPIQKQEGTSYLAEINSFQISEENFKAILNEPDSHLILKSGKLLIDVFFENMIKEKLKEFYTATKNK
jgi:hypothetical protein